MDKQFQPISNVDSLVNQLASSDSRVRTKARKSLVKIGEPVVVLLSDVLANSKVINARWEAAKALGKISDPRTIPTLINSLEDSESDVAWLAAVALEKFEMAAWPELFRALIERGAESVKLRHGAHHVLRKQRAKGFNELLEVLRKALESHAVPESTPMAAYKLMERMRTV